MYQAKQLTDSAKTYILKGEYDKAQDLLWEAVLKYTDVDDGWREAIAQQRYDGPSFLIDCCGESGEMYEDFREHGDPFDDIGSILIYKFSENDIEDLINDDMPSYLYGKFSSDFIRDEYFKRMKVQFDSDSYRYISENEKEAKCRAAMEENLGAASYDDACK
jgi:hypothetical protein